MPMSGMSDATLGDGGRGIELSQRFPTQLHKGLARGGVGCAEVEDIGQNDEDRIAPLTYSGGCPGRAREWANSTVSPAAIDSPWGKDTIARQLRPRSTSEIRSSPAGKVVMMEPPQWMVIRSAASVIAGAEIRTTRRWPERRPNSNARSGPNLVE